MGQEIKQPDFSPEDFASFAQRLNQETDYLSQYLNDFDDDHYCAGFELEAWLIDQQGHPSPHNQTLIGHPLVVPELSRFNIELNSTPRALQGDPWQGFYKELQTSWSHCQQKAAQRGDRLLMIGILPTVKQSDLILANMSPLRRYQALNEQVLKLRQGRAIQIDIAGDKHHLRLQHQDVMLEAATTSFQLHLQVPISRAAAAYNLSKMIAAPMVALSANSPFLFQKSLWAETRIPLFEQSVDVGGSDYSRRVTFGIRYADSILDCFIANRDRYPILLPQLMDEPLEKMAHLRLHNGTIWRWNRPLIGFNADGQPHIRIEHRVVPSGPSLLDMIANAAFYFGWLYAALELQPVSLIAFEQAKHNFYQCAQHGLKAELVWQQQCLPVKKLILEQLLPQARLGLESIGSPSHWLDIIEKRVHKEQNGANWQKAALKNQDFAALVQAYYEQQESGKPVHDWD